MLFEESDTDMAVAQTVPYFSYWKQGFSPVANNHALAERYPDRVILCGGVDPVWQTGGVEAAVREMERQVLELGARTFKFYNWQYDRGWHCDDRELAYPLYEKAAELGINHIQFHKGTGLGLENVEKLRPNDLQAPARDFPEMVFVIHHMGEPYHDETVDIAGRFRNVWIGLSAFFVLYNPVAPYRALHMLGRALQVVGPERLLYGSESFAWLDVQAIVESFANMQMPEELQDNYGYPYITPEMRRMIFGENQARLFGLDIPEKVQELERAGV
jgi:predicted TIM-barrel fold metal-dependent hydrolase